MQILHTADDGQEPQAGAAPDAAATPPAGTTTDAAPAAADAPTLTPAEARALRNEAKNLRTRLRDLEAKEAEAQRAQLSEAERIRGDLEREAARASALEAEVRGYRLRDAIEAAVGPATLPVEGGGEQENPLHGISPRLAVRLLDPASVETDEAGAYKPAALRRALQALASEYPEIRPAAPPPPAYPAQRGVSGNPPPAKVNPGKSYIDQRYGALPPNVTKR